MDIEKASLNKSHKDCSCLTNRKKHSKNSEIKFVAANCRMGYNIAQTWGKKLSSIVFAANLSKQWTTDDVSYPKSGRNNTLFQDSIHTTKANFCCR